LFRFLKLEELIAAIAKIPNQFFGPVHLDTSPHLGRIINSKHFERLERLVQKTNGDLVLGGLRKPEDRFMDMHVYTNVKADDILMEDELFGPILPIVRADSIDEALDFINSREKPLSLYVFSKSKATHEAFLNGTSSGSVCINDVIVQFAVETLPFGGVGGSGYGAYHGKHSFDTFTHKKSVLVRDFGFIGENLVKSRYPPYTEANLNMGTS